MKRNEEIAFGANLRRLRLESGLTQERLGELCDLHRVYISSVERGERNVSLVNILKLAKALGVDPSELLNHINLV